MASFFFGLFIWFATGNFWLGMASWVALYWILDVLENIRRGK